MKTLWGIGGLASQHCVWRWRKESSEMMAAGHIFRLKISWIWSMYWSWFECFVFFICKPGNYLGWKKRANIANKISLIDGETVNSWIIKQLVKGQAKVWLSEVLGTDSKSPPILHLNWSMAFLSHSVLCSKHPLHLECSNPSPHSTPTSPLLLIP